MATGWQRPGLVLHSGSMLTRLPAWVDGLVELVSSRSTPLRPRSTRSVPLRAWPQAPGSLHAPCIGWLFAC